MKTLVSLKALSGAVAVLALVGCGQQASVDAEPPVTSPLSAEEHAKPSIKLAPPITTVKPGASVAIVHDPVKPLQVGENGAVTLSVNEGYPNGTLMLEATGSEGLNVFGATATTRVDMAGATTHSWRIDFQGDADGIYYLNLMTTAEPNNGLVETRAFSVRVPVGNWEAAQAKVQAEKTVDTLIDGEIAVVLPAQETIN